MTLILFMTHCFLFFFLFSNLLKVDHSKYLKFFSFIWESPKAGQHLYQNLIEFDLERPNSRNFSDLSQYKFYTDLVKELLASAIRHGTTIKKFLPEIKQGLVKDIQYAKKINSFYLGGVYQIFLISIFGFIFIYVMENQLNISIKNESLILPVSLQVLGITFFTIGFFFLKKIKFFPLIRYLKSFYKLRVLVDSGSSLKKIAQSISADSLSSAKDLVYFKKRIELQLQVIRNSGQLDRKEIELYINEMWQMLDFKFEEFSQELNVLKLLVLCFFSLSGYLLLLYQAFSQISL